MLKKETRGAKQRGLKPEGNNAEEGLLDFDVISSVDINARVGDEDGGGIVARVDHNAFTEHFAGQIVPLIFLRRTAKAEYLVLIVRSVHNCVRVGSLISENTEIIANFDALIGTEVYIDDGVLPVCV